MPTLDRKKMQALADRALCKRVEYHFDEGMRSDSYRDQATGGVYEHRRAQWIGLKRRWPSSPTSSFRSSPMEWKIATTLASQLLDEKEHPRVAAREYHKRQQPAPTPTPASKRRK
jgi:hypothetical protein